MQSDEEYFILYAVIERYGTVGLGRIYTDKYITDGSFFSYTNET